MEKRILHSQRDVDLWCAFLKKVTLPVTVAWKEGADRSTNQNDLAFKWYTEASVQLGDRLPHEIRAYCKLHHGVPIRREEEDFREVYDRVLRPLAYEDKLAVMIEPIDFPITRDMTTKQMTRYLDAVFADLTAQGARLTLPEEKAA